MPKRIKYSRASITRHAQSRMQQRGINDMMVQLIEIFGELHYQKGGSELLSINKKTLKNLRHTIDKLEGVTMVTGDKGKIITTMHQTKKIRSTHLT
jgi:hypothetical protein